MAATAYTTLVARVRTLGNDTSTSNFKPGDTPEGTRDASNRIFRLHYPNLPTVASGLIYCTYGTTARSSSLFTILDAPSGYITMGSAPDAGTTNPFHFDYYYQWFIDADYNTMLDLGTEELGGTAGTDLAEGLYPAQVQYALSHYWGRRSSQYANLFPTTGGGANAQPQMPAENFLALAKIARANGDDLRDSYYKGFRGIRAPSSGTITYGISRGTPRR